METGVHCILNRVTGKRYIGSTVRHFRRRQSEHLCNLRAGYHSNPHLQADWNAMGQSAFEFIVLDRCDPDECLASESFFIKALESANPTNGYNVFPDGDSPLGYKHSAATREKLRQSHLGYITPAETRAKQSAAARGKKKSAQTRANMRAAWVIRRLEAA